MPGSLSLARAVPLALALAVLLAPPPGAAAEGALRCFDRARLAAHLEQEYGETRKSVGYREGRGVVEFYANARSGSWTVLLIPDRETGCVLETGVHPRPPAAAESPA
jgi:hypothetical protein